MTDKLRSLVDGLLEKTRAGEITWEEYPRDDVFQAALGDHVLTIERQGNIPARPWQSRVKINIYNMGGKVVESFDNTKIENAEQQYGDLMEEIHSLARRQALGADQAISDILERLETGRGRAKA
jgi:hypothetical protein